AFISSSRWRTKRRISSASTRILETASGTRRSAREISTGDRVSNPFAPEFPFAAPTAAWRTLRCCRRIPTCPNLGTRRTYIQPPRFKELSLMAVQGARRAQSSGRQRRFKAVKIDPGRRLAVGQAPRCRFGQPRPRQCLTRDARYRVEARPEPVDDRDRHQPRNIAPALPAMETAQIVGAHDPDKTHARTTADQIGKNRKRIGDAEIGLEIGDVDAGMLRELARSGDAFT